MVKVSALEEFEPHTCHSYDFSYDTYTGWFQEADSRMIQIRFENLLHIQAKINKLIKLDLDIQDFYDPNLRYSPYVCMTIKLTVKLLLFTHTFHAALNNNF